MHRARFSKVKLLYYYYYYYSPDVDFCQQASRCCHIGVDEYGWIAAAVGWSLWFLTLILLCVDKLMKLTPEEPKDLPA